MSGWIWYLIASGVICWTVVLVIGLGKFKLPKLSFRKSLVVVVIGALVLCGLPSGLWWQSDSNKVGALNAEAEKLVASFSTKYGEEVGLIRVEKPDSTFIVFRQDGDDVKVSTWIGNSPVLGEDVWMELGTLEDPNATETEE